MNSIFEYTLSALSLLVPQTEELYSISAIPNPIVVGERTALSWKTPIGANLLLDWVAMYKSGLSDRDYIEYKIINFRGGDTDFVPPDPGIYDFRYFKHFTYDRKAISPPLTVVPIIFDLTKIKNYPPLGNSVVAFGDSLTKGKGASPGQDFPSELSRETGISIVNAGVIGDQTGDVLLRLDRDVLSLNPQWVIVFLTGNDFLDRVPVSVTTTNLSTIIH